MTENALRMQNSQRLTTFRPRRQYGWYSETDRQSNWLAKHQQLSSLQIDHPVFRYASGCIQLGLRSPIEKQRRICYLHNHRGCGWRSVGIIASSPPGLLQGRGLDRSEFRHPVLVGCARNNLSGIWLTGIERRESGLCRAGERASSRSPHRSTSSSDREITRYRANVCTKQLSIDTAADRWVREKRLAWAARKR